MANFETRDEEGGRFVATGKVKGKHVEVVAGWDVVSDMWRYHVYAMEGPGPRKINGLAYANSKAEAFEEGFKAADAAL